MSGLVPAQAKASSAHAPLGFYVHVPFCASTCDFCAFYQTQPTAGSIERYLDCVATEASLVAWKRPVTTVFWGGGTPGLLAARDLEKLGAIVRARCGGAPLEWTVELAPGSVTEERLTVLRAIAGRPKRSYRIGTTTMFSAVELSSPNKITIAIGA